MNKWSPADIWCQRKGFNPDLSKYGSIGEFNNDLKEMYDKGNLVGVSLKKVTTEKVPVSQHNTTRLRYWNLGQPGASADKVVRILHGCEKVIHPSIIIVCWPAWSRREKLHHYPESLTNHNEELMNETNETDKHNFLKNVFLVEKFAEKNQCKTFHCFAQDSYQEHIKGLNVLEDYTIKNCWPYWDKFEQRVPYNEPSLAADGEHYGAEHHERFAQLFLGRFGSKLK